MYVLTKDIAAGADTYYLAVPRTGRVSTAYTVVDQQAVATAAKTLTLSDGTTDIGVITVANSSTEGTMDEIVLDSTSLGKVEVGPALPIKIVMAGAGNGKFTLVVVIDTYHSAT